MPANIMTTSYKARPASSSDSGLSIPSGSQLSGQRERYASAQPYKYAAISGLITDDLVSMIRAEKWLTPYSSNVSSRSRGLMGYEVKKEVFEDGVGSRKKLTSTRYGEIPL
jgi:hypothetical protein